MWRVLGTLSKESYDRNYTDRELLRRLVPYVLSNKKYFVTSILFTLMRSIVSLVSPILFAIVFDELVRFGTGANINLIWTYSILYVIFLAGEWVLSYFAQINKQKLQSSMMYDLRHNLFKRINQHELRFFDKNKTGLIMSRVSGDAFQVGSVMSTVVDLAQILFYSIFIITTMFIIKWDLTLISIIVIPALFLLVYFVSKKLRNYSKMQRRAEAAVNSAVEEYVRGIQITKSFGQEKAVQSHYDELQKQKLDVNSRRMFVFRSFPAIIDFFTAIALYFILVGGGSATLSGIITPGILYLFITYLRRLFEPLIQLGTFYATLQGGLAAAERMFSLMDVPVQTTQGIRDCPELKGEIEFKNVLFNYTKSGKPVLDHFSLIIPAGQTLAIVGETGAGKTTIASLLARFYEHQEGNILLDGVPLKEIKPDSLRNQLGYVLQEPFLFSGTIKENLLLGSPAVTDEQVKWAIEAVKADTFIKMLPEGLNTRILEQGKNLSQGQKQLLSLARILLKDPRILILDEATASVDAFTEKMIQDALDLVFKDRTTIVIAHRLSTVLNADRIIVLEEGKILEEGDHETLIERDGAYRALYQVYYAHQGALEELV